MFICCCLSYETIIVLVYLYCFVLWCMSLTLLTLQLCIINKVLRFLDRVYNRGFNELRLICGQWRTHISKMQWLTWINLGQNRRGNQEWPIQRHWQHWIHTGRRQTKHKNTKQYKKLKGSASRTHHTPGWAQLLAKGK